MVEQPFRIEFVCLGNICRSPTAHVVLEQRIADAGLSDRFQVASSGTSGWHTGKSMDPRSAAVLEAAGYDASRHRASDFTIDTYAESDLILAMDYSNRTNMLELAPTVEAQEQVRMFRSFDPEATANDEEVPDPWGGGDEGFHTVLAMIERTCDALVEQLKADESANRLRRR